MSFVMLIVVLIMLRWIVFPMIGKFIASLVEQRTNQPLEYRRDDPDTYAYHNSKESFRKEIDKW